MDQCIVFQNWVTNNKYVSEWQNTKYLALVIYTSMHKEILRIFRVHNYNDVWPAQQNCLHFKPYL